MPSRPLQHNRIRRIAVDQALRRVKRRVLNQRLDATVASCSRLDLVHGL